MEMPSCEATMVSWIAVDAVTYARTDYILSHVYLGRLITVET